LHDDWSLTPHADTTQLNKMSTSNTGIGNEKNGDQQSKLHQLFKLKFDILTPQTRDLISLFLRFWRLINEQVAQPVAPNLTI